MVIANTPWADGLRRLHAELAEYRDRGSAHYRVTNVAKYEGVMTKIDAYMANARLMYPSFFYSDAARAIMDRATGKNFAAKRKEIDKWN